MGCMLRSDPMTFCDMFLQPEAAFAVLSRLGEMGCVQFIDMKPELQAFQRNFVMEVCRFAEMERKLRYIHSEMTLNNIPVHEVTTPSDAVPLQEMLQLENQFEKWENDIVEMTQNEVNLMKSYLELAEFYYILTYIGPLLGDAEIRKESIFRKGKGDGGTDGRLIVITGVVQRTKCFAFEMMLWRISHGIVYYKQASEDKILMDPVTRKEIRKVAFLAVCQGEQLAVRMYKICNGFRVNTYPCPNTYKQRQELMEKLEIRLSDLTQVLNKTKYLRRKAMYTVGKQWTVWMQQVRKSKAIYHTMNLFNLDITKKCLIGQCWIPDMDLDEVNKTLSKCSETLQSNVPSFMSAKTTTNEVPPTYHRTNKFTNGFQALINAFGDSTYRELNPGLYTLITFPFLFGMMFGDMGHGLILFMFGAWMWKNEKKFLGVRSDNEIWNIFLGGRYVILMLGLFSMFTGFFYNDLFAKSISFTRSYWVNTYSVEELSKEEYIDLDPSQETYVPYLFGKDPLWSLTKNKIMFENSIKMKLSIIFGIIHMIFGIILSLFNHLYFRRHYAIFLQFLPELFFLTFLFFWLVILIYFKWFSYNAKTSDREKNTSCAPQILLIFIDMVLMSETQPANDGCKEGYMFPGQRTVQMTLVFLSVVCVPIMLFGPPLFRMRQDKKKRKEAELILNRFRKSDQSHDKTAEDILVANVEKYSASFGEQMIHQGVHTIEFVLSTISHTASYLRLWALSLAHAQLSEMLWGMVLSKLALKDHTFFGSIKVFVIFSVWAVFTICILVVMEGLSAFLHTLRLHWVEFMSKFYAGGGYPFRPFSFRIILSTDTDKTEYGCKKFGKKEDMLLGLPPQESPPYEMPPEEMLPHE